MILVQTYLFLTLVTNCVSMIKSLYSKETKKIWLGEFSTKLPKEIQQIARRKLRDCNEIT